MPKSLQDWASERGYLAAVVEPSVLDVVRDELDKRRAAGEFDQWIYEIRYAAAWKSLYEPELAEARAVVLLSIPRPAHRLTFLADDGAYDAIVAPTYAYYTEIRDRVKQDLQSNVIGSAHRLTTLSAAPLKAIAARTGLVTYGRHNITFAPGFGSYHQLAAFLTDADLGPRHLAGNGVAWMSPECEGCDACAGVCPTGAIGSDRFLLHAERCLALFTEEESPWPEWISDSAHNCLFGCLACQEVCPQNAGRLVVTALEPKFEPEETRAILSEPANQDGPVWERIKSKLQALGLAGSEPVLGRNLKALIRSGANAAP